MYQPTGPSLSLDEFAIRWAKRGGVTYHDYRPTTLHSRPVEDKESTSTLTDSSDSFSIALQPRPWAEMRQYLLSSLQKETESAAAIAASNRAAADRLRERKGAEDAAKTIRASNSNQQHSPTTKGTLSSPKPHVAFDSQTQKMSEVQQTALLALPKPIGTLALRESIRSLLGDDVGDAATHQLSTLLNSVGTQLLSVDSQVHKHNAAGRAQRSDQMISAYQEESGSGGFEGALLAEGRGFNISPDAIEAYFSAKLLFEGSPSDGALQSLLNAEATLSTLAAKQTSTSPTAVATTLSNLFSNAIANEHREWLSIETAKANERINADGGQNVTSQQGINRRLRGGAQPDAIPLPPYTDFLQKAVDTISPAPAGHHFTSLGYFGKYLRTFQQEDSEGGLIVYRREVTLSPSTVATTFLQCSHVVLGILRRVALSVLTLVAPSGVSAAAVNGNPEAQAIVAASADAVGHVGDIQKVLDGLLSVARQVGAHKSKVFGNAKSPASPPTTPPPQPMPTDHPQRMLLCHGDYSLLSEWLSAGLLIAKGIASGGQGAGGEWAASAAYASECLRKLFFVMQMLTALQSHGANQVRSAKRKEGVALVTGTGRYNTNASATTTNRDRFGNNQTKVETNAELESSGRVLLGALELATFTSSTTQSKNSSQLPAKAALLMGGTDPQHHLLSVNLTHAVDLRVQLVEFWSSLVVGANNREGTAEDAGESLATDAQETIQWLSEALARTSQTTSYVDSSGRAAAALASELRLNVHKESSDAGRRFNVVESWLQRSWFSSLHSSVASTMASSMGGASAVRVISLEELATHAYYRDRTLLPNTPLGSIAHNLNALAANENIRAGALPTNSAQFTTVAVEPKFVSTDGGSQMTAAKSAATTALIVGKEEQRTHQSVVNAISEHSVTCRAEERTTIRAGNALLGKTDMPTSPQHQGLRSPSVGGGSTVHNKPLVSDEPRGSQLNVSMHRSASSVQPRSSKGRPNIESASGISTSVAPRSANDSVPSATDLSSPTNVAEGAAGAGGGRVGAMMRAANASRRVKVMLRNHAKAFGEVGTRAATGSIAYYRYRLGKWSTAIAMRQQQSNTTGAEGGNGKQSHDKKKFPSSSTKSSVAPSTIPLTSAVPPSNAAEAPSALLDDSVSRSSVFGVAPSVGGGSAKRLSHYQSSLSHASVEGPKVPALATSPRSGGISRSGSFAEEGGIAALAIEIGAGDATIGSSADALQQRIGALEAIHDHVTDSSDDEATLTGEGRPRNTNRFSFGTSRRVSRSTRQGSIQQTPNTNLIGPFSAPSTPMADVLQQGAGHRIVGPLSATRNLYKKRLWQDALLRLYVGPTRTGSHFCFYPQQKLPLLGVVGRRVGQRSGKAGKGGGPSAIGPVAGGAPVTVGLRTRQELLQAEIGAATDGASATLPPLAGGASTQLRTPQQSSILPNQQLVGAPVREEHWVSFMGIVFNLSAFRGTTAMEHIDRAAGRACRAGLGGRRLYYEVLLAPTCSGRDITVMLAHRLSSVDGWDFNVTRSLMATGDVPIVKSPHAPLMQKTHTTDKNVNAVSAAAQAAFFTAADPNGAAKDAVLHHSASPMLGRLSPSVRAEMLAILSVFLHDFEVIGVLDNGLRYCMPLVIE